ncbi:putative quinol monooxygenase [Ferrimonas balearica]|uniref:putative quinol monooxygenase n=1 Tax=Ferrimonas balearica TaxID=44012 RepID=UPI001C9A173F|nr:putative quinol monooxygenase [Ferrimonas balearica]MBY5922601.1 antibiotic biosynthesis monooxygenase [Ferrimonas balearica]MBY5995585.1 antibiotic biosynthesis monooxygenase [Ferrimonas balearica]
MAHLTIVANIIAHPESAELVKTELLKLIEATRAEAGCVQYDLHQDNDNPAHFLFFENWQSRALWRDHMASEHIKAYLEATEGAVAVFTVNEMTRVG